MILSFNKLRKEDYNKANQVQVEAKKAVLQMMDLMTVIHIGKTMTQIGKTMTQIGKTMTQINQHIILGMIQITNL